MGLGLTHKRLIGLTPREYEALRRVWDRQQKMTNSMFFQLRADIYNSSENLNRADKQRWTAQDFGAEPPPEPAMSEEFQVARIRANMLMKFGAGKNSSLGKLKGQSLPVSIADKIRTG